MQRYQKEIQYAYVLLDPEKRELSCQLGLVSVKDSGGRGKQAGFYLGMKCIPLLAPSLFHFSVRLFDSGRGRRKRKGELFSFHQSEISKAYLIVCDNSFYRVT